MISLLVKETLYINEVILGTAFGVLIGPYGVNVFDPRSWGDQQDEITLTVMRLILVSGLFAAGIELPCAYMKKHARGLLVMVVPTMTFGWFVVAAVLCALFPQLHPSSALCIAACLTPTDPVTCVAITRGKFAEKHVPESIRDILTAEAAANDGLAYPFLSISMYLLADTVGVAIGKGIVIGWLYEVMFGSLLGSIIGLLFSKLMKLSHRKGLMDRESYIAQYLALAILTTGITSSLGADDLLASFAAGCAVAWDGHFKAQTEGDTFASVIDCVLNCCCFIYIGAWLPFSSYNSAELGITPWRLVVLMIAILLIRRIPPLLLLYRFVPEIPSWKEALFSGHFGPVGTLYHFMGVSAVFVSTMARTRLPLPPVGLPENPQQMLAATIEPIVSFVVLGSILVHGLSIPFFNVGREFARSVTITSVSNRVVIDLEACGKTRDSGNGGIVVPGNGECRSPPVITTREVVAVCQDHVESGTLVSVVNEKVDNASDPS
ncbi:Cation/H+ exchanger [Pisolithus croceorrhizus]|nr:Cation/H+ exchanger [Pisolithus croceorrhizus]